MGSIVRNPTIQIYADGVPLAGAFEVRLSSSNFYTADHFSIRILRGSDLNHQPDYLLLPASTTYDIGVALSPENGFTSLMTGQGNYLVYDHLSRGIRINGRDLSAAMQDSPINDTFANLTSSEIVVQIASRHHLTPVVTQTQTLVGRYYHDDTCQTAANQFHRITTEWDLLVFLARCENFDIFVSGRCIFFQPMMAGSSPTYVIRPENLLTLRLKRRLQLSGDIRVTVRSWSSKASCAVSQTAISRPLPTNPMTGPGGTVSPVDYYIVQPNFSVGDATRVAGVRAEELARHEQSVEFTMPGEVQLTPRDHFTLEGTNSIFDQAYQIDTVERTISPSSGFLQRLTAHSILTREIIFTAGAS